MSPFRILLIDDDVLIREVLEERLATEGYQVRVADSGKAAIEQLATNIFDAALLDIHLPDMTGIEILEELKRRDPEIDVVIMTGYPQVDTAIQALRLGAYDYLTKPVEWLPLKYLFQRIIER